MAGLLLNFAGGIRGGNGTLGDSLLTHKKHRGLCSFYVNPEYAFCSVTHELKSAGRDLQKNQAIKVNIPDIRIFVTLNKHTIEC